MVRQTVSKWDRGLSVPDAEMLVAIGEVLDTPVSTLPGETVPASEPEGLQALSEKLEVLNDQFARAQESKRRAPHALCIAIAAITAPVLIALATIGSSYLEWDFSNPEYAVAATLLHGLEWVFVRITPIVLLVTIAGTLGTRRKAWHGNWTPPPSKQQPFARYARELPPKLRHDVHETGPAWT